jgi:hypothetical protein
LGRQIVFGDCHARLLRQVFHGLYKGHAGVVHQEANGIAILATAKTMEKLFGGADRKTGRFFAMERAQAHEVGAAFFELDVAAHDLHDINAGE